MNNVVCRRSRKVGKVEVWARAIPTQSMQECAWRKAQVWVRREWMGGFDQVTRAAVFHCYYCLEDWIPGSQL